VTRRSSRRRAAAAGAVEARVQLRHLERAVAASRPLLRGLDRARQRLVAVFVVSTPNAIGTPVSCAARMMPCDAACAM
jgi:hypothetical protein